MTRQAKAYGFALLTIAFWSTIATACKLSLRFINPALLVFYASLTSTLVLFGALCVQKKTALLRTVGRQGWLFSLMAGALNPFAYYLVLFKAYDLLPAQQAQVLNYTWAITLSVLAIPFLGQRIEGRQWLAVVLSYCGVLVIATKGRVWSLHFDNLAGVGFALLSTVLWSIYWIINTKDNRDPVLGMFLNFLCALPCIAIYLWLGHGISLPRPEGLAGAVYLGFFEMGLAFIFWLMALKLSSSTARIANLIFLSPFVSLIFIRHVVGEQIHASTFAGLFLVIGGLLLQVLYTSKG